MWYTSRRAASIAGGRQMNINARLAPRFAV